ncbi:TIGR04141 family sporadically distributed protein [Nocardia farcinica]|uniref:DUF6119 family protein n=1 Tax=Nocardia farcinica TaxID=37329 RepID=UPI00189553F4|nr:DUF6119 family protein [Nocardia farcinica]MBF6360781.1 TIGR04141 family sporadically distributed protein [Nocardia farcinica]
MKLNIFMIPVGEIDPLRTRLNLMGMELLHEEEQPAWRSQFYFLETTEKPVKWLYTYKPLFLNRQFPTGIGHSAVYLFESDEACFALAHGFAHFYVRPYCDYDFGIDLAKRIVNQDDVSQTASKRFQGKTRKEIRSYASNTRLDVASGESVDFIQARITLDKQAIFGTTGKFGTSAQLSPKIQLDGIGNFLSALCSELAQPERFRLPRTVVITEKTQVDHFDQMLIKEIRSSDGDTDFTRNSFEMCGVDFMFGDDGTFGLRAPWKPLKELDSLSIDNLRDYINEHSLTDDQVLKIKVINESDGVSQVDDLKASLDFIADAQRVVLSNGKWMHFNQDYLDFLDEYVRDIDAEIAEPEFLEIEMTEPSFNKSEAVINAGYEVADKNFDIFKTKRSTPVEAWDLKKGETVYAVKFGTAQKLHYVCDQARGLLALFGNRAGVKQIPGFSRYCLWLGYEAKSAPQNIADSNSIILKQKIEAWARACHDLGVTPVIKLSRRVKSKRRN